MAYTAGTGFRYFQSLNGQGEVPTPVPLRIANSTTLRIGDLVRVNDAGFLVTAAVGEACAGVLLGFVDEKGINPFSLGYNRAGVTLTGDDTLATSATNQTRADFIRGEVCIDPAGDILWLNDANADLAQTRVFQYFDADANGRQITVTTGSDSNGVLQLILWDPQQDPATADASKGAFRIAENQFGLTVDSGTAKIAA